MSKKSIIQMSAVAIIILIAFSFLMFVVFNPIYEADAQFKEDIAAHRKEREKLEEEFAVKEEKRLQEQKDFEENMLSFETDTIHFEEGVAGSYAEFVLDAVAVDAQFNMGQDLPYGENISLRMNGRGEVGIDGNWSKAGSYGVYHYDFLDHLSREGQTLQFEGLESVQIKIDF